MKIRHRKRLIVARMRSRPLPTWIALQRAQRTVTLAMRAMLDAIVPKPTGGPTMVFRRPVPYTPKRDTPGALHP